MLNVGLKFGTESTGRIYIVSEAEAALSGSTVNMAGAIQYNRCDHPELIQLWAYCQGYRVRDIQESSYVQQKNPNQSTEKKTTAPSELHK